MRFSSVKEWRFAEDEERSEIWNGSLMAHRQVFVDLYYSFQGGSKWESRCSENSKLLFIKAHEQNSTAFQCYHPKRVWGTLDQKESNASDLW